MKSLSRPTLTSVKAPALTSASSHWTAVGRETSHRAITVDIREYGCSNSTD